MSTQDNRNKHVYCDEGCALPEGHTGDCEPRAAAPSGEQAEAELLKSVANKLSETFEHGTTLHRCTMEAFRHALPKIRTYVAQRTAELQQQVELAAKCPACESPFSDAHKSDCRLAGYNLPQIYRLLEDNRKLGRQLAEAQAQVAAVVEQAAKIADESWTHAEAQKKIRALSPTDALAQREQAARLAEHKLTCADCIRNEQLGDSLLPNRTVEFMRVNCDRRRELEAKP